MDAVDKAGKSYWSSLWDWRKQLPPVDPADRDLNNYVNRRLHQYFCEKFTGMNTSSMSLLEIGCAGSAWLPYFARQFSFRVMGIDYTEVGCHQAREVLRTAGVNGDVICGDLFDPPNRLVESFDVVVSFGLVEHFVDTAGCLKAMSRFLKPRGVIITNIPNFTGVLGRIQSVADRKVYDVHVLLDREALAHAHEEAGFIVHDCSYFLSVNWAVLNFSPAYGKWVQNSFIRLASWSSKAVWILEKSFNIGFRANRFTSPYIMCCAIKR